MIASGIAKFIVWPALILIAYLLIVLVLKKKEKDLDKNK
jgi:hypothetical protein